jgi:hypothetical protein
LDKLLLTIWLEHKGRLISVTVHKTSLNAISLQQPFVEKSPLPLQLRLSGSQIQSSVRISIP